MSQKNCQRCFIMLEETNRPGEYACSNCGEVQKYDNLTTEPFFIEKTKKYIDEKKQFGIKYLPLANSNNNPNKPFMKKYYQLINNISITIQCSKSVYSEIKELCEKVFNHPLFLFKKTAKKKSLVLCCVYLVCRTRNWPVTKQEILNSVDYPVRNFGNLITSIMKVFPNYKVNSVDIMDLIEKRCYNGFKFDKNQVNMAQDLVRISQNVLLTNGRKEESLLNAIAYFVWLYKFHSTSNYISYLTIKEFCLQFKLKERKSFWKAMVELTDLLYKLALQLPWFSITNSPRNKVIIARYLNDIIDYQKTLTKEAIINELASESIDNDFEENSYSEAESFNCPEVNNSISEYIESISHESKISDNNNFLISMGNENLTSDGSTNNKNNNMDNDYSINEKTGKNRNNFKRTISLKSTQVVKTNLIKHVFKHKKSKLIFQIFQNKCDLKNPSDIHLHKTVFIEKKHIGINKYKLIVNKNIPSESSKKNIPTKKANKKIELSSMINPEMILWKTKKYKQILNSDNKSSNNSCNPESEKRKVNDLDLDREMLDGHDIDETEMFEYLKTSEEISLAEKLSASD